jgi:hypothetical protein
MSLLGREGGTDCTIQQDVAPAVLYLDRSNEFSDAKGLSVPNMGSDGVAQVRRGPNGPRLFLASTAAQQI